MSNTVHYKLDNYYILLIIHENKPIEYSYMNLMEHFTRLPWSGAQPDKTTFLTISDTQQRLKFVQDGILENYKKGARHQIKRKCRQPLKHAPASGKPLAMFAATRPRLTGSW